MNALNTLRNRITQLGAAAIAAGLLAGAAHAQATRIATVEVTPLVADQNVPRQIKVSGTWPHACGPMAATLVDSGANNPDALVVRLTVPQTFAACAQVLTPYSYTVTYAPAARGVKRVAVLTSDGEFLGDGTVVTRGANDNAAAADVTGVWYDPATNGSGLTFIHNGANVLFGTWYVYDGEGKPRWYTIQNVTWSQQGRVFLGTVYETQGRQGGCPAPFAACPVEAASVYPVGLARFTLVTPTTGKIEAIAGNGIVLMTSNLVKVGI